MVVVVVVARGELGGLRLYHSDCLDIDMTYLSLVMIRGALRRRAVAVEGHTYLFALSCLL